MNSKALSQSPGVAFSCDSAGRILSVIHDDFGLTSQGTTLVGLVDSFSVDKARNFLASLNQDRVCFGWDLNVNFNGRIVPITFNAACTDSAFLVVGASTRSATVRFVEALSAMNNEQTTALRSALKQIAEQQRGLEDQEAGLFDELSRLNNELVTLQRQLARKNRELEQLNRLKDTFLGMASHDLRKPISGILTLADLMADSDVPLSAEQQTHLRSIRDASRKVIRQLNDFLDIAQIESGNLRLDKQLTALGPIVALRTTAHQRAASSKGITLSAEIAADIPSLLLDSDRLEQVLDNLVENALKYTPVGGRVTVRLRQSGSTTHLSVSDTGPGLTAEQTSKLFAAFQPVGSKTTGGEKSTGLGLAIVKAIIQGHGATISVESEPSQGATFIVKFPAGSEARP